MTRWFIMDIAVHHKETYGKVMKFAAIILAVHTLMWRSKEWQEAQRPA